MNKQIELKKIELENVEMRYRKIIECENDLTISRESLNHYLEGLRNSYKMEDYEISGVDIQRGILSFKGKEDGASDPDGDRRKVDAS